MQRIPVVSSMIRDIGYDPQAETLEIGFQSGMFTIILRSRQRNTTI